MAFRTLRTDLEPTTRWLRKLLWATTKMQRQSKEGYEKLTVAPSSPLAHSHPRWLRKCFRDWWLHLLDGYENDVKFMIGAGPEPSLQMMATKTGYP